MNHKSLWLQCWCFVAIVLTHCSVVNPLFASDDLAISEIFAEQHTTESAWTIHHKVQQLPAKDRFEFLTNWILPNSTHAAWRLQFGFTPTNPPETLSAENTATIDEPNATGGEMVSPVYDWLETARELGELDAVIAKVHAIPIEDASADRVSQLAILLLAESYRGNTETFEKLLSQFIETTPVNVEDGPTNAEWLVYEYCLRHQLQRNDIAYAVYRYFSWTRQNYTLSIDRQHWGRLIGISRRTMVETLDEDQRPKVHTLKNWQPASRMTAQFNGEGRPTAVWDMHAGYAENLVSYQDDYLYYAIPLQGTFRIEWEAQAFDWRDTHLLVGRRWVYPSYLLDEYEIGNYRFRFDNRKLSRKLTKTRDWFYMRVEVEDNIVTTYVNGLLAHREVTDYEICPWIGIHSDIRRDGGIRNLRITGNPRVPDAIPLLTGSDLSSWSSYFGMPVGMAEGGWIQRDGVLETDMAALPDHHVERLLLYQRPLFEDGEITYEFFYEPGQFHTHPAIGRLAFLMEPDGVKIHRVTDGPFERTDLDPANVSVEPANQIGGELPLVANAWNRVRVTLEGDTITLNLNDKPIYRHQLAATNPRTFGYFQFIDRARVKVRNVVHRGAWLREVPPTSMQEMAFEQFDPFDGKTEHLADKFAFNFANNPQWYSKFEIHRGNGIRDTKVTNRGLFTTQTSEKGYRGVSIAPKLTLKGDFDIVADFEDYEADTIPGGNSTLYLIVYFETPDNQEYSITRRKIHDQTGTVRHQCQCIVVQNAPGQNRRNHFSNTAMEEHAGKLRLTRTGNTLSYFTAQGDSQYFQLRGQIETLNDRADVREIRLVTQIFQKGEVSAVWKSLSIQAEELTGEALETSTTNVADLDQKREQLAERFQHDFTKNAPTPNFALRSGTPAWNAKDKGWRIPAVGQKDWFATGFQSQVLIDGNFDLSADFEVLKVPEYENSDLSTVYLQVEIPDDNYDQISALYENNKDGESVRGHLGMRAENGQREYAEFGTIPVKDITGLRVCRYGSLLTLLAKTRDGESDTIVTEKEVGTGPLPPRFIRFMVNTRGEGLETVVLLKSVEFRADRVVTQEDRLRAMPAMNPVPAINPMPAPVKPPAKPSLFDAIRNLFR